MTTIYYFLIYICFDERASGREIGQKQTKYADGTARDSGRGRSSYIKNAILRAAGFFALRENSLSFWKGHYIDAKVKKWQKEKQKNFA